MIYDRVLNYVLDAEGNPVAEPDLMAWGRWMKQFPHRIVDKTEIGDVQVSTVFLGHDHNFFGEGPPVLWETMVFGGEYDQWQWRYASEHAARRGHGAVVDALRHGEAAPGDFCDGTLVEVVGGEPMERPCRGESGHAGDCKAGTLTATGI